MAVDPKLVAAIRRTLTQEVLNAAGLPRDWWGQKALDALLWLPTFRFSRKMARFDAEVASLGLAAASANLLQGFVERIGFWGQENIPMEGPVLLACNHPGAYDSFAVAAGLRRDDMHLIASGVNFTRSLPEMSRRFIYVTPDAGVRMAAVRQGLRHLERGGLLLVFPTGLVDPDPALWPQEAQGALQGWSQSLDIFMRRVPETRLVVAVASHVLAESCIRHPLTRLVRQDWQQRRLAEYLQVFQQLVFGRRFGLAPRVSYMPACSAVELQGQGGMHQEIHVCALQALQWHLHRAAEEFKPAGSPQAPV
jgi:hypothetical protein